ncbi:hypothetical protein [Mucilaginibacter kameinonensis]|uniref:hypothetical protein n=1 Tax=Mucilaginibacter kameinonensis TaxID=452286 RepID=UPI000EF843B5|nr:hypothetical protein [Mucilaginibacter kameinonensis]
MDSSVNFQELKEELRELGFSDPRVTNRVGEMIFKQDHYGWVMSDLQKHGQEESYFIFDFGRGDDGRLNLLYYAGHLSVNGDLGNERFQHFLPGVPGVQALRLLDERAKYPELDFNSCYTPLSLKEVKIRLEAFKLPVPLEKKLQPIMVQLTETGFNDPNLCRALQQKIEERQERFYLESLSPSGRHDILFTLNFAPDTSGQTRLDNYRGCFVSQDPIARQKTVSELYHPAIGEHFEAAVNKQLATTLLETRPTVKPSGYYYNTPPLTDKQVTQLLNQNSMNTQNVEFLKNSLLNLGFGDKINDLLEKKIQAKEPEFALLTSMTYNQKDVAYALHFKAGNEGDMYFFNKFDAALNSKPDEKQSFYINKGNGITAKEAFNLMEGRAVHKTLFNKEDEKYQAWLKLDDDNLSPGGNKLFKRWNENYGFDVEKVLSGKGIKEMATAEGQEALIKSLKKGNAQQVTVDINGKEQKFFVTANPQFKTVDVFDNKMKKVKREELLQPEQKQSNSQKQDNKQNQGKQQKEELPAKKQKRVKV